MPNKVAIVTDSTAYLPEECLKQYNISVTPLSVVWGEQDLPGRRGYSARANSTIAWQIPKSCPPPRRSHLRRCTARSNRCWSRDMMCWVSSSPRRSPARSSLPSRHGTCCPNAADKIAIVDSLWTTMALGWPVLTAARAAQAGESLAECQKVAENACAEYRCAVYCRNA